MKIIAQVCLQTASGYLLPGKELELETEEGQRLIARGLAKKSAVTEQPIAAEPKPTVDAIAKQDRLVTRLVKAISLLKTHQFNAQGKPLLQVLRTKLKKKVTPAQRDAAWQQYQAEKKHDQ